MAVRIDIDSELSSNERTIMGSTMHPALDLEIDLMKYCVKHRGTRFWHRIVPNQAARALYGRLRKLDASTVIAIVGNGGPDFEKHIQGQREMQRTTT
ncbi:MAG: hypothetical protein V3V85_03360 [Candidatus Thorarchaeota archaeon]